MGELASWRRCPVCGAGLESVEDGASVECASCGFRHYASSKVTACAVVVGEEGKVLLARRASAPFAGRWDLPGGFVGEGEHPEDAVRRELREETGLEVEPNALIGIWMDHYSEDGSGPSTLNVYYAATARGGGEAADDVSELLWASPDDLPAPGEFAFHIADVLRVWRDEHA